MLYHSTRSNQLQADSAQAVLSGLAPDGGLYVPAQLPQIDVAACLQEDTMAMAARIIGTLLPDIGDMDTLVRRAYTDKFQTAELTPTVDTGTFTVLELFRGPTSAFKDVALCMLPQLLTAAKGQKGMDEDILILTATSGDTGKAALAGFADVEGVKICVFYPQGGVSRVILGSAALEDPALVKKAVEQYGQRIAVGIDAKNGQVAARGWLSTSSVDYLTLAKQMENLGVSTIIYTDIAKDGMMLGPNFEQMKALRQAVSCDLVASGGIRSLEDLQTLQDIGIDWAILGKSIYQGAIDLAKALKWAKTTE